MNLLADKIRKDYANIAPQGSEAGRVNAYMNLVDLMHATKPSLDDIVEASLQGSKALGAIDAGFAQEAHYQEATDSATTTRWIDGRSDRVFARSGAIVVANTSHILAVRGYTGAESMQDQPPAYHAVINAARAVLCYTAGIQGDDRDMDYAAKVDERIQNPHRTQQIAFASAPSTRGEILVGGASGIRPSEFALIHLDESVSNLTAPNQSTHLSGFFGRMAAVSTLSHLSGEAIHQESLGISQLSANIRSLVRTDVNVH